GDDNVDAASLTSLDGIKDHRGAVSALFLGNDRYLVALTPDLQLLDRRRPEGIARGEQDRLALVLEALGQLANGRGFANAVNPDHQDDIGLIAVIQFQRRAAGLEQITQLLFQRLVELFGVLQLFALQFCGERIYDFGGG